MFSSQLISTQNPQTINFRGKVILSKTQGRNETWVKTVVPFDYFLSLQITHINDLSAGTTKDAFNILSKFQPEIQVDGNQLNTLFQTVTLPPNATDVLHVTLGNFPDFRYNRDISNDIDPEKVALAESLQNKEVCFTATKQHFQLLGTSHQVSKITLSAGTIQQVPTVGYQRDGVLVIKIADSAEEKCLALSKSVFGDDFVLWDAKKNPISSHLTIAQTNQLTQTLNLIINTNSPSEFKMS